MSSSSQWGLIVKRSTFLNVDLFAGLALLAWAVTARIRPEFQLESFMSSEAAFTLASIALTRWYAGARNGNGRKVIRELGSIFILIAIAPLIPIVAALGAGALGLGVYLVTRERREPGQVTAAEVGLPVGTKTAGGPPLFTQAERTLTQAERTLTQAKPPPPPIPDRSPQQTKAEYLAEWQAQWMPVYLKGEGCKKWYWGFNALQVARDAASYGGAKVVSAIIGWVLAEQPELTVITDQINFKFRFKLNRYSIGDLNEEGYTQELAKAIWRINEWTPKKGEVPPVPLPDIGAKYKRSWMLKQTGGIYEPDDKVVTIIRPISGNIYAGMPTWEWTWLTYTTQIRKLFRQDQINISLLSRRDHAACGDYRWWMVTRKYVDEIYK